MVGVFKQNKSCKIAARSTKNKASMCIEFGRILILYVVSPSPQVLFLARGIKMEKPLMKNPLKTKLWAHSQAVLGFNFGSMARPRALAVSMVGLVLAPNCWWRWGGTRVCKWRCGRDSENETKRLENGWMKNEWKRTSKWEKLLPVIEIVGHFSQLLELFEQNSGKRDVANISIKSFWH